MLTKKIEPITLIYIVSHGYPGSTLLDLMLGSQPKTESVGEIINIDRYLSCNQKCSCGKRIRNCEY